MLFIHPMWDNESQRIGMQKCSPIAYGMHAIGGLIGFLGLLALFGILGWLAYLRVAGEFTAQSWWLLSVPLGIGIVSEVFVQMSWIMAARRGFEYDYKKREASWNQGDQRITYRYARQDRPSNVSGADSHHH